MLFMLRSIYDNRTITYAWATTCQDITHRSKLIEMGWQSRKANDLLIVLEKLAVKVDDSQITGGNYDEWLHNVNDHPVMATAIAGRVDSLVTSNTSI